MQAFIDESLDNVLPKFRQCAKDFTHLLCTLLKILNKIFKIEQKRMGQYKKRCSYTKIFVHAQSIHA